VHTCTVPCSLITFLKASALRLASNSHLAILFLATIFSLQQFFSFPKASHIKKAFPIRKPKAKGLSKKPQSKSLASSFREFFIPSDKQGRVRFLGEGMTLLTGDT
jgi:hypothetical protein